MSRLTDLLRAAKRLDPQLGEDLERELKPLQKRLPFGLNFERHAPEAVELPGHPVRVTSKVRILPSRGETARGDQRLWRVNAISGGVAELILIDNFDEAAVSVPVDDLLLVAEFRDRIYPGLRLDDTVERGGDKPFHSVISGENYHVLEQLTFTHEHDLDAIYIDPPYNSGSRDWKYNNDYVEGDDLYRHSKWLAFMERRLKIAKRLLKPHDSVLIVTIDEKEYLRLGLLLEQTFPEARIQMVSSIINPKGTGRANEFSRVEEFIYFVALGDARVQRSRDDMISSRDYEGDTEVRWRGLARTGRKGLRSNNPGSWYPIYVRDSDGGVESIGETLPLGTEYDDALTPAGTTAVWPPTSGSDQYSWSVVPETLRDIRARGGFKSGAKRGTSFYYLTNNQFAAIESGALEVSGRDASGALILAHVAGARRVDPRTVWNRVAHDAGTHGTGLVTSLLPGRRFPFPKALYAVEDALRFFVADKPDAKILDFFSGSGTTAHAVMRLNRQDGGRRQTILVTNNEVSADEQRALRAEGLRPGDDAWEKHGICDYITKPRMRAAITGRTPDNEPIKGNYRFIDEFPMAHGFEENAAFFTLMYESPWRVTTDRAFAAIAPMLWLRAGARGNRIDALTSGWAVAETYGVLKDLDQASEFVAALQEVEDLRIAYIVTDDEGRYQQVANDLQGIETVRLYEDYLRNCESTGDL